LGKSRIQQVLKYSMDNFLVLGADIGGSHITTALVDLGTKTVIEKSTVRTRVNAHGTAEDIISQWCEAMQQSAASLNVPIGNLGIAMPGPFDYEAGISLVKGLDKFDALYGMNVKELLAEKLNIPTSSIRMLNDAACFLQGEVFCGSAKGFDSAIGLTLGTGLGTSRYHHNLAEDANLWCMPFYETFAEDYISTRWFVRRFNELTGQPVKDVKALVDLADSNRAVRVIFDEFAQNLTEFLIRFIEIDKPDVIVLGGNISNAFALFKNEVVKGLAKSGIYTSLYLSNLKEDAALIGAASLWLSQLAIDNTNNKPTSAVKPLVQ
jgi:glucokinase